MTDIEANFLHVGELRAYLARPAGGSTGAMLLLPMITGIGAQVREYAEDIARAGATARGWGPGPRPRPPTPPPPPRGALVGRRAAA
ncbi:hypothetical protein TVH25_21315, partial [Rhodococcus sp. 7Tela_A2]